MKTLADGTVVSDLWGTGLPWWAGRCWAIAEEIDFVTAGEYVLTAGQVEQVLLRASWLRTHKARTEK